MAEDDNWRRQMAEARYGEATTPGFARNSIRMPAAAAIRIPSMPVEASIAEQAALATGPYEAAPITAKLLPPTPPPSEYHSPRRIDQGTSWPVALLLLTVIVAAAIWLISPPRDQLMYPRPSAVLTPQRAHIPTDLAKSTAPVVPSVLSSSPPMPIATADPDAISSAMIIKPVFGGTQHPVAHAGLAERLNDHDRTVSDWSSPRSDRSTPSQAPSAVIEAQRTPSFQCRPNQGEITGSICADQLLASLDRRLAARFAALDESVDPATIEALHHGETTFLNARQLCSDKACLAAAYRERLRELDAIKP